MKNHNHTTLVAFQLVPINNPNAFDSIDAAIDKIKNSDIKHQVQHFNTVMEGDLLEILNVVMDAREQAFKTGSEELILNLQIRVNKNKSLHMEEVKGVK